MIQDFLTILTTALIVERFFLLRKINQVCDKYLGKGKVYKDKQTKLHYGRRNNKRRGNRN